MDLLAILLLVLGLAGASSQLGSLSAGTILGPGTGKTARAGWIVLEGDLGDEQTCGTTLASAYVLCRLSAAWSQLQMKERSPSGSEC